MDIDLARVTAAAFCFWVAGDLLRRPGRRLGPQERERRYHQQLGQLCARSGPLFPSPHLPTKSSSSETILDIYTVL